MKDDGSFSLSSVNPDNYSVTFSGLPDGFYVKAILTGGQDVLAGKVQSELQKWSTIVREKSIRLEQ